MRSGYLTRRFSFFAFAWLVLALFAPHAEAKLHFFPKIQVVADVPSTTVGSAVTVITTPAINNPVTTAPLPPLIVTAIEHPDKDVHFAALAAANPTAANVKAAQPLFPSIKGGGGIGETGAVVARNPAEAAQITQGAKSAVVLSANLLNDASTSTARGTRSTALETDDAELYAFEETSPIEIDSTSEGDPTGGDEAIIADIGMPGLGTLVASNDVTGKPTPVVSSRAKAWSKLDELATEYAYALAFAGNGLLFKDGKIFATWAIGHAIHQTNQLTRGVIQELKVQYQLPKSTVRDKKIRFLSQYLKNPKLMEINDWLRLLGPNTIVAKNGVELKKKD